MTEQQMKDYLADVMIELEDYENERSNYTPEEAAQVIYRLSDLVKQVVGVYQNNKNNEWFVREVDGKVFTYIINFKGITDRIDALTDYLSKRIQEG